MLNYHLSIPYTYYKHIHVQPIQLGQLNSSTASIQRGKTRPHESLRYDIKQSDGETPALEISGMRSTPSLPLLPGPLSNSET